MPSERIYLRMRCNQACLYCNSHWDTDNPNHVGPDAIVRSVKAAIEGGADEIILTGGEPTLLPGLEGVVAFIRDHGIPKIVLETNATLVDESMAGALADAGLTMARVNLSGWGSGLDEVTQDPGGFKRARAGIAALMAAGIPVSLSGALVRSTMDMLPELPRELAKAGLPVDELRGLWLNIPVEAPDPTEILSLAEAAQALKALDRAARSTGLLLQLNPEGPLRPCMLTPISRYAHLFTMTTGGRSFEGNRHLDVCEGCLMKEACLGVHEGMLRRFETPTMVPVTTERMRRRLSLRSSVAEQIENEYLTRDIRRGTQGVALHDYIVRVNFSCNQACRFCFVSTHLPAVADEKIRAALREAGDVGARITFSGGEPCLNPRLVEYVQLAKSQTSKPIELQTNATRLGDEQLSRDLAQAGVDEVFISLHGSHGSLSDGITDAPGTFEQTVKGIDTIVPLVPKTTLHFVICKANAGDLKTWVGWVANRWPGVSVNFSFVGFISDVVPRDEEMLPRYTDVLPGLEDALVEAQDLGLHVGHFHSMCGIPLCLAPKVTKSYMTLADVDQSLAASEFIKPEPCQGCELKSKCFGIRRGYADLYGIDELKPFGAP